MPRIPENWKRGSAQPTVNPPATRLSEFFVLPPHGSAPVSSALGDIILEYASAPPALPGTSALGEPEAQAAIRGLAILAREDPTAVEAAVRKGGLLARVLRHFLSVQQRPPGRPKDDEQAWPRFAAVVQELRKLRSASSRRGAGDATVREAIEAAADRLAGGPGLGADTFDAIQKNYSRVQGPVGRPGGRGWREEDVPDGEIGSPPLRPRT